MQRACFQVSVNKDTQAHQEETQRFSTSSGLGQWVHIIQPIHCKYDLDTVKELVPLVHDGDVNKAFLQFAARYLSNNKSDSYNRTSLKSCLLRIPGSINSKCKKEVKILQEWDRYRPDFKLMLGSFYSYLTDQKQKEEQERAKYAARYASNNFNGQTTLPWIEKLLVTPIDDYRQLARDLIIIPYLVVRRGITDPDYVEAAVMSWADMCNGLEPLNPSYHKFKRAARKRIYKVSKNMIPPMRFERLQQQNPELAKELTHPH